jgi:hypothetical protein
MIIFLVRLGKVQMITLLVITRLNIDFFYCQTLSSLYPFTPRTINPIKKLVKITKLYGYISSI